MGPDELLEEQDRTEKHRLNGLVLSLCGDGLLAEGAFARGKWNWIEVEMADGTCGADGSG